MEIYWNIWSLCVERTNCSPLVHWKVHWHHKLAKNGAEVERYLRSVQGQEVVRLLFRPWTGQLGC